MEYKIFFESVSLRNRRATNMDRVFAAARTIDGSAVYLFAVSDGVGSLKDGALAAQMAVQMLGDWFEALSNCQRIGLALQRRVEEINKSVLVMSKLQGVETAATLSVILISAPRYYIVHAGDSRIYSFDKEHVTQLTVDHSNAGRLSSSIGRKAEPDFFYDEGECDGLSFLLCTDGLYKRMNGDFFAEQLHGAERRTLKRKIMNLVNYVVDKGESDNISAVLALNDKKGGAR